MAQMGSTDNIVKIPKMFQAWTLCLSDHYRDPVFTATFPIRPLVTSVTGSLRPINQPASPEGAYFGSCMCGSSRSNGGLLWDGTAESSHPLTWSLTSPALQPSPASLCSFTPDIIGWLTSHTHTKRSGTQVCVFISVWCIYMSLARMVAPGSAHVFNYSPNWSRSIKPISLAHLLVLPWRQPPGLNACAYGHLN